MSNQVFFGLDGAQDLQDFDIGVVREFIDFFPENGLSKVLKGYLGSGFSQFPLKAPQIDQDGVSLASDDEDVPLTPEDCLILMSDGVDEAQESVLAHRLMGEYYLFLDEYESAVETTRKGLKLVVDQAQKTGLKFQKTLDALNSTLATALIHYQTPKNHPEAKEIFEAILARRPTFTPALIGVGFILEEEEDYSGAIDFLGKALENEPSNARIGAELAWCRALNGDYALGLDGLEEYLQYPQMDASNPRGRELRAQTLYRIGICEWELHPSASARKNRQGAYTKFLAALKANPSFAPAYTSLGIFYEDYRNDKKRARQCFQKAFELSSSELIAAERLARSFADQGEWDIVEVIAQRVVDSGKLRPAPGSKKDTGVSWPFSALGVVQMNKQEYQKSIMSFLSALRISPDDYHSYVGLGESYHNSGRYNSAARAFRYADNPTDGVEMKKTGESWFTKYMLANVNRELGEFDEAIQGYEEVLEGRPNEFGVSIALLQTLVERAWRKIETGFFGGAADSALQAIDVATTVAKYKPGAFNLWKAVGDASAIFSWVQERLGDTPLKKIQELLKTDFEADGYDLFNDIDGVGQVELGLLFPDSESDDHPSILERSLHAALLAQKRAIHSRTYDVHAQAVAWYNLGWTEYRAHVCLEQRSEHPKQGTKFLKAAMKCFKRSIELEAGNSEFWNSLGVITTTMNAKVAQHSFVRSLHLNERSARTWTNLGTLYLLQSDLELAHMAFSRAQSTDPEYAQAWVGEGLIALLLGDAAEALSHFTHAFEISDSASLITKRQYGVSTFDYLTSSPSSSNNITHLIQPLFALHQLSFQSPSDIPHRHLAALYLERVGNYSSAISALTSVCATAEAEYEDSESPASLSRFAQAKADIARNQLAAHAYTAAVEDAEIALDLISDPESCGMSAETLRKTRLSARLTTGLAHYYLNDMKAALAAFRAALQESKSAPDVVCLVAEVLWAKGGEEEKSVAREQLFASVETHPDNIGSVILLGAMAALDEDAETIDAVLADLQALRTSADIDSSQLVRVEKVLAAIAAVGGSASAVENETKTKIMLNPAHSIGWQQLAECSEEPFPAQMALKTALKCVPPAGPLHALDLARAFAGTGTLGDAQRAVVLAPWDVVGWKEMGAVLG
ncbi:TPR-like protein [Lepidopterella palustris CBS 459.81]|uniref:TPR-like protein n=1 Tax=Lepidopterella palustris CBS 459.81 TaxID=1314670 RepID=A0A8E2EI22_9PEZI|nr:TPR-like protein [Lepidopterella palustris CBS 459.81]